MAHHPYRAAIRAYALISPAGACFIDSQGPAIKLRAIQGIDGLLRLGIVFHLDKPEATRPSGFAIGNHLSAGHRTVLLEERQ